MTHSEFVMWLQGFLNGKSNLTIEQIVLIETQMKNIRVDAISPVYGPIPTPQLPYVVTCNALYEDGYALGAC